MLGLGREGIISIHFLSSSNKFKAAVKAFEGKKLLVEKKGDKLEC